MKDVIQKRVCSSEFGVLRLHGLLSPPVFKSFLNIIWRPSGREEGQSREEEERRMEKIEVRAEGEEEGDRRGGAKEK